MAMAILHTTETASLGEMLAAGRGLLLRYRDLSDQAGGTLAAAVDDVIAARAPLLDRVEAAIRRRDQLPPAADKEPNELHALFDSLAGAIAGDELLATRIVDAERGWAELLETASGLDWDSDESETLSALRRESAQALARLGDVD
jgi:hypothetical protein